MSLRVRVQPRAHRDELLGMREGALVVRLAAPPVEGEANAALMRFLAGLLDRPRTSLQIRQGRSGRDKVVMVTGADIESLRARLVAALREVER